MPGDKWTRFRGIIFLRHGRSTRWERFLRFLRFFSREFSQPIPATQQIEINYPRLELPPTNLNFEYNMNHENRGIALIFNHENFEDSSRSRRRTGTHMDKNRLISTLNRLSFNIKVFDDLTRSDLLETCKKGKNGN